MNETFGRVSSEKVDDVHPDFTVTMTDNPVSNALQLLILKERSQSKSRINSLKEIAATIQASHPGKQEIDNSVFAHDPIAKELLDLIKTLQKMLPKGKTFDLMQLGKYLKDVPLIGNYLKPKKLSSQFKEKEGEFLIYENESGYKIVILLEK